MDWRIHNNQVQWLTMIRENEWWLHAKLGGLPWVGDKERGTWSSGSHFLFSSYVPLSLRENDAFPPVPTFILELLPEPLKIHTLVKWHSSINFPLPQLKVATKWTIMKQWSHCGTYFHSCNASLTCNKGRGIYRTTAIRKDYLIKDNYIFSISQIASYLSWLLWKKIQLEMYKNQTYNSRIQTWGTNKLQPLLFFYSKLPWVKLSFCVNNMMKRILQIGGYTQTSFITTENNALPLNQCYYICLKKDQTSLSMIICIFGNVMTPWTGLWA